MYLDGNLILLILLSGHCTFWILRVLFLITYEKFPALYLKILSLSPNSLSSVLLEFQWDACWPSRSAFFVSYFMSFLVPCSGTFSQIIQFSNFLHWYLIWWLAHLLKDFFPMTIYFKLYLILFQIWIFYGVLFIS